MMMNHKGRTHVKKSVFFRALPEPLHIIWQIVMKIPASDSGGWGGVGIAVITICHENQHLHLRGGASEKEDSASPREDKILPRTCISFLHT